MILLDDKLYTSTEVADILGVSLRSVYRYIEEGKLDAEVKTATGRHRFSKQNIMDFLYPNGSSNQPAKANQTENPQRDFPNSVPSSNTSAHVSNFHTAKSTPAPEKVSPVVTPVPEPKVEEAVSVDEEEPIDWLSKFREAAKKFEEERANVKKSPQSEPTPAKVEEKPVIKQEPKYEPANEPAPISHQSPVDAFSPVEAFQSQISDMGMGYAPERSQPRVTNYYYRSRLGGLKDIAQNIDKSAKNSGLDYAFTMNAGLSLFKPIKPFSMLHSYIRSKDKDFFERILMLIPSDSANAQLCLNVSDDAHLFDTKIEMHGLNVVSRERLLSDISTNGDQNLLSEAESVLM